MFFCWGHVVICKKWCLAMVKKMTHCVGGCCHTRWGRKWAVVQTLWGDNEENGRCPERAFEVDRRARFSNRTGQGSVLLQSGAVILLVRQKSRWMRARMCVVYSGGYSQPFWGGRFAWFWGIAVSPDSHHNRLLICAHCVPTHLSYQILNSWKIQELKHDCHVSDVGRIYCTKSRNHKS